MSIRLKTILVLISSFTALMAGSVLVLNFVVTPKFLELERKEVHNNLDRVVKEFDGGSERLASVASDWGRWDDPYRFLTGAFPKFEDENLDEQTILNLGIELIIFFDTKGSPIVKRQASLARQKETDPDPSVIEGIAASRIWSLDKNTSPKRGFIMAGQRPLLFASRPVTRSDGSSPPAGYIFVAKFMEEDFLKAVSKKLNLSVSLTAPSSPILNDKAARDFHDVTILESPSGSQSVLGFSMLNDIYGKPFLAIGVEMPRELHRMGISTMLHSIAAMVTLGALFTAMTILIVDRTLLRRLAGMTAAIRERPGRDLDLGERELDEIGILASSIEKAIRGEARRAAELEESEKRKELALSAGELGFWEYSPKTGEAFFSDRLLSMLGYKRDELKPSFDSIALTIHPDDRETAALKIREAVVGRNPTWDMEYKALAKDGRSIYVHSRGRVLRADQGGNPELLGSTVMDVTEKTVERKTRAQIEEQLKNVQKMQAISTMAGGVAHNFNNILAVIQGYTELIMDDLEEGSVTQQNAREILSAATRAGDLINQLMIFSKERERVVEKIDIRKIVQQTFRFMREVIPTSIDMVYTLPQLPAIVTCDKLLMRQAFINICTNAMEAMNEKRGSLRISVTEEKDFRETWETTGRDVVIITFSDDGRGMSQEVAERAFEPYFTTKGAADRAGLGLAMVHGTITECAGMVSIKSSEGIGTTVIVTLPAEIGKEEKIEERKTIVGGKENILFVDDEELLVNIAKQQFKRLGYRITGLTHPAEALEAFMANPRAWDVVITDMTMPGLSGSELATKIHQIRPEIPIILCSGRIEGLSKDELQKAGILQVVKKPVTIEEMAAVVRSAVDKG